jgi:hypothetical protein
MSNLLGLSNESEQQRPPRCMAVTCAQARIRGTCPSGPFHWAASFIFLVFALSLSCHAQAFNPKNIGTFLKGTRWASWALPDETIIECAKKSLQPGGTKLCGKILGDMKLPNEVFEDTYARILIQQQRVTRSDAKGWMHRLSGVDGFRTTMRKCSSANLAGFVGHVNEIRIADDAVGSHFKVKGIGVPFKDPWKNGMTDIDVILVKGRREFVIEAKSYPSTTPIPLDTFRADMVTLAEYRKANPGKDVQAVFQITEKPSDPKTLRLLEEAAKNHNVELIYDNPAGLIVQIERLL